MSRVVVITGASAGVGRAAAIEFARKGDRVALLARSTTGLQSTIHEIESIGGQCQSFVVDVSDAAQVEAVATQIEKNLGTIDVWVNNAMVTVFSPFIDIEPEEYRQATQVTYLGTVYGTLAALKRMRPRKQGVIIQVGSALAYTAIPLQSAYCGAKFAIRGFTDAVRAELLHDKIPIQLSMVQLAAFNTPQFNWSKAKLSFRPQPVPPVFHPQMAARAIEWTSRHKKRELWVGFPVIKTIVATLLFPGLVGRMAAKKGWEGQLDKREPSPNPPLPDNLFNPVEGTHATMGRFSREAKHSSIALWLALNRAKATALIFIVFLLLCLVAIFL